MDYRHEKKHEISFADLLALRAKFCAVLQKDPHAIDGKYEIRSLYFDDLYDTALKENLSGISRREKFRIRYYNGDASFIRLEKKSKLAGLGKKESAKLSYEEADALAHGEFEAIRMRDEPIMREFYRKLQGNLLRPRTIVDYTREAFLYAPGNVRVTLDYHIRTGLSCTDLLVWDCVTIPIPGDPNILEVKWDGFLPSLVHDLVQTPTTQTSAFSKYASCRLYD